MSRHASRCLTSHKIDIAAIAAADLADSDEDFPLTVEPDVRIKSPGGGNSSNEEDDNSDEKEEEEDVVVGKKRKRAGSWPSYSFSFTFYMEDTGSYDEDEEEKDDESSEDENKDRGSEDKDVVEVISRGKRCKRSGVFSPTIFLCSTDH